jgi:hypothetical protein
MISESESEDEIMFNGGLHSALSNGVVANGTIESSSEVSGIAVKRNNGLATKTNASSTKA